ncbi:phage tail protein [Serratia marcescens]|uniref:Contractile injection system protein, VgrG/Pvc8 family n=1 Tax=Serratia marcescens TaxID=615 RepID=A0ABD5BHU5_SERMA|nr:contractile injection system protein, VgrG/Pvc8 family [Serratia marcescens]MCZ6928674.1 phage tail protein [Serratia marcescens]MDE5234327.1 contractile injection system protein, VgrG/Pvc8 family [Serratia marcescens]MDE5257506.1 contractile injection system protein, VgrG/Pvc8 family [Serratia marcescens]MDQ9402282.1 contractile injection system protein, VgrG/Pvc8 family [Serratia marcescens]MDQ9424667.1 contractile injection system protein, VgrG/Pvc8 family [Serratia marcescens]
MTEELTLNVDGKIWGGWTEMTINRSLDNIAGEFDLTITARWSAAAPRSIKPGQACSVSIGNDRVMTGYIDDFIPSYDAENVALRVLGRDKTGDLVDSSVVDKSGQWRGQKLEQLAATICKPYGIEVINETDTGEAFGGITLEQGETGFELLNRLAKQRGVLITSDAWGRLVITRASTQRASVALVLGENILAARGRFSWRERASQYIVKGSAAAGGSTWDDQPVKVVGGRQVVVTDAEITRYRPKILVNEDNLTVGGASARGEWSKAAALGDANTTEITVAGWRENVESGALWQTNRLVPVKDAIQQLDVTWLIKTVSFMEGDNGRVTVLSLVPPESMDMPAQKAKGKKGKKTASLGVTWD